MEKTPSLQERNTIEQLLQTSVDFCLILQVGCGCPEDHSFFMGYQRDKMSIDEIVVEQKTLGANFDPKSPVDLLRFGKRAAEILITLRKWKFFSSQESWFILLLVGMKPLHMSLNAKKSMDTDRSTHCFQWKGHMTVSEYNSYKYIPIKQLGLSNKWKHSEDDLNSRTDRTTCWCIAHFCPWAFLEDKRLGSIKAKTSLWQKTAKRSQLG